MTHTAAAPTGGPSLRNAISHVRFVGLPVVLVIASASIFLGQAWPWLGGIFLLLLNLVLDEVGGDYRDTVEKPNPTFLNAMLYITVPLTAIMTLGLLAQTASPGFLLGEMSPRSPDSSVFSLHSIGAMFTVGVVGGWAAGSFGHELMHRPTRYEWLFAQLLLARCVYTAFAIEHVYGHHRNVGLPGDVTTAPRGMGFWRHMLRAIVGVHRGAAQIEARRMRRRGYSVFGIRNMFLQGLVLEIILVVGVFALAGPAGLAAFFVSAAISVLVVESGAYLSHYGLVRIAGHPVRPRHSWNAPRFFSTSTMVNSPRHSHHHRSPRTPYWQLTVLDDAPIYPFGTAVMGVIAFVPRLFFSIVDPLLRDWDERLASEKERALLDSRGWRADAD